MTRQTSLLRNTPAMSEPWFKHKALAGEVLTLRAQYLLPRGSWLQQLLRKAKAFCGTVDSFNTTSMG